MADSSCYYTVTTREIAKGMRMHITIRGFRTFTFRVWVATKLIQLAAFILPFQANVSIVGPEEE